MITNLLLLGLQLTTEHKFIQSPIVTRQIDIFVFLQNTYSVKGLIGAKRQFEITPKMGELMQKDQQMLSAPFTRHCIDITHRLIQHFEDVLLRDGDR